MHEADRQTGILGKLPAPRGDADPPSWGTAGEDEANRELPFMADGECDDPDTLLRENRGPARGIVVAVVPAVLVWVVLIALLRKLL
jgi:hypothetical protein